MEQKYFNVEMPDGTLIEDVPVGTSKEVIQQKYSKMAAAKTKDAPKNMYDSEDVQYSPEGIAYSSAAGPEASKGVKNAANALSIAPSMLVQSALTAGSTIPAVAQMAGYKEPAKALQQVRQGVHESYDDPNAAWYENPSWLLSHAGEFAGYAAPGPLNSVGRYGMNLTNKAAQAASSRLVGAAGTGATAGIQNMMTPVDYTREQLHTSEQLPDVSVKDKLIQGGIGLATGGAAHLAEPYIKGALTKAVDFGKKSLEKPLEAASDAVSSTLKGAGYATKGLMNLGVPLATSAIGTAIGGPVGGVLGAGAGAYAVRNSTKNLAKDIFKSMTKVDDLKSVLPDNIKIINNAGEDVSKLKYKVENPFPDYSYDAQKIHSPINPAVAPSITPSATPGPTTNATTAPPAPMPSKTVEQHLADLEASHPNIKEPQRSAIAISRRAEEIHKNSEIPGADRNVAKALAKDEMTRHQEKLKAAKDAEIRAKSEERNRLVAEEDARKAAEFAASPVGKLSPLINDQYDSMNATLKQQVHGKAEALVEKHPGKTVEEIADIYKSEEKAAKEATAQRMETIKKENEILNAVPEYAKLDQQILKTDQYHGDQVKRNKMIQRLSQLRKNILDGTYQAEKEAITEAIEKPVAPSPEISNKPAKAKIPSTEDRLKDIRSRLKNESAEDTTVKKNKDGSEDYTPVKGSTFQDYEVESVKTLKNGEKHLTATKDGKKFLIKMTDNGAEVYPVFADGKIGKAAVKRYGKK